MERPSTATARRTAAGQLENYRQKLFCDVILSAVGDRETTNAASSSGTNPPAYSEAISQSDIHCHRSVLSSHSSYFKTILSTEIRGDGNQVIRTQLSGNAYGMVVKEQGEKMVKIVLKDFQPHFLKPIVDYIYSGSIVLTCGNFKQIYENAKKLMVDSLIEECERFLNQPINASNCLDLMICAHEMKRVKVEEKAVEYFTKNIKKVFSKFNDGLKDVPLGVMEKLMKSGKIDAGNAEEIFQALIIWTEADKDNRLQHLQKLMEPNIGLLSHNFLLNFLADTDVVSSDLRLMKLVMTTLKMKQLSLSDLRASSTVMPYLSPLSGRSYQSEEDTLLVLTSVWKDKGNGVHEKFDRESNTWSEWKTKDLGEGYGAAVLRELLFVIGEVTTKEYKRTVQIYNFSQQKWTAGPNMNQPRTYFGCSVVDGHSILVCGGKTTDNEVFAECEMLQLNNTSGQGTWRPITPMSVKRLNCSSVCLNNKVYVCGGRDKSDDKTCTVYSSVEEYDLITKQWRKRSDMKEARINFGLATHEDMIYVFGGWRDMRHLSTCERYDPSSDTWQYMCSLPSPRQCLTVGVLGDKIHIIGAYNDGKGSNITEVYDVEQNEFSTGPNLNHAAYLPKCVVVKKKYLK